ncbi:hypothetical protein B1729_03580 [Microbacterium sp. B35-04]|uniref:hypothetical protein n=1 Tax=Microbacterium sp. B35-04 TaxID=1961716 RepID=UPI0013D0D166|nr:hypothetical protein [Microbacterium sp. B35-04]KAF2414673.1 hypothetical protein B1729_03580 [Microbacterium sp. B35-04]
MDPETWIALAGTLVALIGIASTAVVALGGLAATVYLSRRASQSDAKKRRYEEFAAEYTRLDALFLAAMSVFVEIAQEDEESDHEYAARMRVKNEKFMKQINALQAGLEGILMRGAPDEVSQIGIVWTMVAIEASELVMAPERAPGERVLLLFDQHTEFLVKAKAHLASLREGGI